MRLSRKSLALAALLLPVTVPATACGGDGATAPPTAVAATVEVEPDLAVVDRGQAGEPFHVTVWDSAGAVLTDASVQWTLGTDGVASVDGSGRFQGLASGQTDVVAASGAASARAHLVVVDPDQPVATALVGERWRASVTPGEEVRVEVLLDLGRASPQGDLGATRVRLDWDPTLLERVEARGRSGFTTVFNLEEPGRAIAALVRTSPVGTGTFPLLELTFRVAASARPGAGGEVDLTFTDPLTSTSFADHPDPIAVDGTLVVR